MTNPNAFLICPAYESPCEAVPPAEYAFVCLGLSMPTWNEDQEGKCTCGAEVYVFITGDSNGDILSNGHSMLNRHGVRSMLSNSFPEIAEAAQEWSEINPA